MHGQLEFIQEITSRRREIWEFYQEELESLEKKGFIGRPVIPDFSSNNGHLYFFLTKDIEERDQVLDTFRRAEVGAVFHYQSLHNSPYFSNRYEGGELINAENFTERLIRLPLHLHLSEDDLLLIVDTLKLIILEELLSEMKGICVKIEWVFSDYNCAWTRPIDL